jgi:hypothetical protein
MIKSEAELEVNLESIARFYRVIARLRRDIAPLNYRNYEIMAEGPIEHIRRLRREIDEYLGIQEPVARRDEPSAAVGAD